MKKTKKKNRQLRSDFNMPVFMLIAAVMGGVIWLSSNSQQLLDKPADQVMIRQPLPRSEIRATKGIVFLGDSITEHQDWSVLLGLPNITNAGISGNTTDNMLARLDNVITTKPGKIFIMAGINDFFQGKSAEYVVGNYAKMLSRIQEQSPDTVIYIQSTLPINNDISKIGKVDPQKIVDLNEKLKTIADGKKIFFIDLYPYFCGQDRKLYKSYAKDGVHPVPAGYAVWKELVLPYVAQSE